MHRLGAFARALGFALRLLVAFAGALELLFCKPDVLLGDVNSQVCAPGRGGKLLFIPSCVLWRLRLIPVLHTEPLASVEVCECHTGLGRAPPLCEDEPMAETPESHGFMGSVRRWLGGRRAVVSQMPARPIEPASGAAPDRRVDVLLAEWQDIRATLRHSDGGRLAQLAVFIVGSAAMIGGYLAVAAAAGSRLDLARWALASLGVLVSLVFLCLEIGSIAHRRALLRRGLQIETAMQVLVPGIGRVKSLALLSEFHPSESDGARAGAWAAGALYGLILLGWVAALLFMAL